MTQMTMEKAEKMLVRARAWSVGEDLSDIQIVAKLHVFNKDLGYIIGGSCFVLLSSSAGKSWELFGICVGLAGLVWAWYLLHLSHRYSQIREMFDTTARQSLKELKSFPAANLDPLPFSSDS